MRHAASVLYGEADTALAERMRSLFASAAPELTLEVVTSCETFVALARAGRHAGLILRHRLPAFDALAAVKVLRMDRIDAPALLLVDAASPRVGLEALRLGADGVCIAEDGWMERLPQQLRAALDRYQPSIPGASGRIRPHRALLVDPDRADATALLARVAEVVPSLTVEVQKTATEALELLAEGCDFDLVLVTHQPPALDAVDFVRGARVRGLPIPVLVIGNANDEQAVSAAFTVGAADFLVRSPHAALELPLRVELAIERAELAQANERAATELMQRQRTLGALRESEKQLNVALEAGRIGLWTWHVGTGHTQFSSHWKAQLGYTDDEIRNDSAEWESRCHPEDLARLKEMAARYLCEPWPDYTVEYRMRHKDGTWRFFLLHADLETDAHGRPFRMIGSQVDVTTLKRQQADLAATSARLQQLSRRLLQVQEGERRHLARELHDEIGQVLTVAKMHLQSAALLPGVDALVAPLQESIALLDRLLAQVRSLSLNLRPPLLDDLGLVPALHWLVQQPQARSGTPRVQLTTSPNVARCDPTTETACFRIAQEAITNAVRHAQARTITVAVDSTDQQLRLSVTDDGVGFDAALARSRAEAGASLGLLGMHERALLVGGKLTLLSAPGRGTEVEAVFPLSIAPDSASLPP